MTTPVTRRASLRAYAGPGTKSEPARPHLPDIDLGDLNQILAALGEEYQPLTHPGYHRPKLKGRPGTEQLLDELKSEGESAHTGLVCPTASR